MEDIKDQNVSSFKLKGKSTTELKDLLREYSTLDEKVIGTMSQGDLIGELQKISFENKKLSELIDSSKISVKPSFYLLYLEEDNDSTTKLNLKNLFKHLERYNNEQLSESKNPAIKSFKLIDYRKISDSTIELQFTWLKIYWYLNHKLDIDKIYEANFGFVIIDFESKKAIITCHTLYERDFLIKVLSSTFNIKLHQLVLTRPLLELIGNFDNLKKARYFVDKTNKNVPENITYADANLSSIKIAIEQEKNPDSIRKESFYRIPLGDIMEQGIGVTSDSGKLWIPRKLTIDEIQDYALALLQRISRTLDDLANDGEYKIVIDSMGLTKLEEFQQIKNLKFRNEIYRLFIALTNMLIKKEVEHNFSPNIEFINSAYPNYFNYPRLLLHDEEQEVNSFYYKNNYCQLNINNEKGEFKIKLHPTNEELDSFEHPITKRTIQKSDLNIPFQLEFIPTEKITDIILRGFEYCSKQIPELKNITNIPFKIINNTIKLNINRALNLIPETNIFRQIKNDEIIEFKRLMEQEIDIDKRNYLDKIINLLGEQCKKPTDQKCQDCVDYFESICLRSLAGKYYKSCFILTHKGIELSDIQGEFSTNTKLLISYGFAKNPSSMTGNLTARNKNGAILIAQILNQIDKTDFDTVVIITAAILNEDIINRIKKLCEVFNKNLVILDKKFFRKALNQFEVDCDYENREIEKIYKNSNDKLKKLLKDISV